MKGNVTAHITATIAALEAGLKRDHEALARAQATLAEVAAKRAEWAARG